MRRDIQRMLDALKEGAYFVDRERRITYWNKAAERLTGFRSHEVVEGIAAAKTFSFTLTVPAETFALKDAPFSPPWRTRSPGRRRFSSTTEKDTGFQFL